MENLPKDSPKVLVITDKEEVYKLLEKYFQATGCSVDRGSPNNLFTKSSKEDVGNYNYIVMSFLGNDNLFIDNEKFSKDYQTIKSFIEIINGKSLLKVLFIFSFTEIKSNLLKKLISKLSTDYLFEKKFYVVGDIYYEGLLVSGRFLKIILKEYEENKSITRLEKGFLFPVELKQVFEKIVNSFFSITKNNYKALIISPYRSRLNAKRYLSYLKRFKVKKTALKGKYLTGKKYYDEVINVDDIGINKTRVLLKDIGGLPGSSNKEEEIDFKNVPIILKNTKKEEVKKTILRKRKSFAGKENTSSSRPVVDGGSRNSGLKKFLFLFTAFLFSVLFLPCAWTFNYFAGYHLRINHLNDFKPPVSEEVFDITKKSLDLNRVLLRNYAEADLAGSVFKPVYKISKIINGLILNDLSEGVIEKKYHQIYECLSLNKCSNNDKITEEIKKRYEDIYEMESYLIAETSTLGNQNIKNLFSKYLKKRTSDRTIGLERINIVRDLLGVNKPVNYLIVAQDPSVPKPFGGKIFDLAHLKVSSGKIISIKKISTDLVGEEKLLSENIRSSLPNIYSQEVFSKQILMEALQTISSEIDHIIFLRKNSIEEISGFLKNNSQKSEVDIDTLINSFSKNEISLNKFIKLSWLINKLINNEDISIISLDNDYQVINPAHILENDSGISEGCLENCLNEKISLNEYGFVNNVDIKYTLELEVKLSEFFIKHQLSLKIYNGKDENYESVVYFTIPSDYSGGVISAKSEGNKLENNGFYIRLGDKKAAGYYFDLVPNQELTINYSWESRSDLDYSKKGSYRLEKDYQDSFYAMLEKITVAVPKDLFAVESNMNLTNENQFIYNTNLSEGVLNYINWEPPTYKK